MISTRDLSQLPDVDALRRLLQSMAMLDAILCPDRELRYYSFNAAWAEGEQMASMRNGSGDDFFAHFGPAGCWLKGFDHEAPMSPYNTQPKGVWSGVLDSVPSDFAACMREPAFSVKDTTFCIWRRPADRGWRVGNIEFPSNELDPDGSARMLSMLDARPETYCAWAGENYERAIDRLAVAHLYRHRPLNPEVVAMLNPDLSLGELGADQAEIGYPG
jgi:hypothetical protein